MKYKREMKAGMMAMAMLLGGSSYLNDNTEVRNSKLGSYKSQVHMKSFQPDTNKPKQSKS